MKRIIYILALLYLSACSSQYGRYQQQHDSKPSRLPTQLELRDATPKHEPYKKANSRPYTVRGKHYQVLKTAKGFSQTGTASWYGKKFHGHLTANGEIYNMYSMSAAHKNLPLPCYLKVTNLSNQKSVIVRVNDRGPFYEDRIIDLSYSAAYKLGMLKTGTAQVEISAITDFNQLKKKQVIKPYKVATKALPTVETPIKVKKIHTPKKVVPSPVIQVFTTKEESLAKKSADALAFMYHIRARYLKNEGVYRIYLGPFSSAKETNNVLEQLQSNGYPHAFKRILFKP